MRPVELDRQTTIHGRTVRHAVLGEGPDVLLCHGTPWSSWLWGDVAHALAARWRVHLWDMPGFGRSSRSAEHPVDLAAQGALLAELAEHWRLDRPHVVAHDIGGAVSLRAHLLHAMPVASFALVDVVAVRPWGSDLFRLVAEHPQVFERIPTVMREAMLRAYIEGASARGLADEAMDALLAPWRGVEGGAAWVRQVAQADERDTDPVESALGTLSVPVSVVWGAQDAWVPIDSGHRIAAAIPGAHFDVIDDAGHLVQLDQPDRLREHLVRWLAAQRSGASEP